MGSRARKKQAKERMERIKEGRRYSNTLFEAMVNGALNTLGTVRMYGMDKEEPAINLVKKADGSFGVPDQIGKEEREEETK